MANIFTVFLENAIYLTLEILYDNSNKKTLLNFLPKIVIKKLVFQICCIFKKKWLIYFPSKGGAQK